LDLIQAKLPPARARFVEAVLPFDGWRNFWRHTGRASCNGSAHTPDLADVKIFASFLAPLNTKRRFVYAKRPFAGLKTVLAYLSRYTHRVAIIPEPRRIPHTHISAIKSP
jgi:hypothetical protein